MELHAAGLPIRVTAISPGFVETEFAAHYHKSEAKAIETHNSVQGAGSEGYCGFCGVCVVVPTAYASARCLDATHGTAELNP